MTDDAALLAKTYFDLKVFTGTMRTYNLIAGIPTCCIFASIEQFIIRCVPQRLLVVFGKISHEFYFILFVFSFNFYPLYVSHQSKKKAGELQKENETNEKPGVNFF